MHLLFLMSPSLAATLDTSGTCGGPVVFDAAGLTPGGLYAVLSAPTTGSTVVPAGACAGTILGLGPTPVLRTFAQANGSGSAHLTVNVPALACGQQVQVVDGATCDVSNVVELTDDEDGDGFDHLVDCDDTDPDVHPGAPEICDGVANDCNLPGASEDGLVTWFDADGSKADLSADFASGAPGAVSVLDLGSWGTGSGKIAVCPGTYHVALEGIGLAGARDLQIEGVGGTAAVVLDSTGVTTVRLSDVGGALTVSGLTMTQPGGRTLDVVMSSSTGSVDTVLRDVVSAGSVGVINSRFNPVGPTSAVVENVQAESMDYDFGGVVGANTIEIRDVTLSGGLGIRGSTTEVNPITIERLTLLPGDTGGVFLQDVDAVVAGFTDLDGVGSVPALYSIASDLELTDFDVAGRREWGIHVQGGTARATGGRVSEDHPLRVDGGGHFTVVDAVLENGGPMWVYDHLELVDVVVRDNSWGYSGGAYVESTGTLTCTASDNPGAGFFRNTAAGIGSGGAVWVQPGGTLISNGCDWGTGVDDNLPHDILTDTAVFDFGDDATFTCGGTTCL
ncbi:MAG: putative metal-binding motif-containing protein [Alphaproteobacteria bacterium]|nr:putative metal-binding motif-containing protein [Alphaproteobacteria bacterium]